ncbi:MAG: type II CRISPR RNA-guided endonuclease Cas9 [Phascolarctobacterium sp.]|nr:type II CRISPR RNA-guided endonuclease Cas9 [Phascolarctobacterium sp.]
MKMAYAIGLDVGIASVGYAVVALDYEENPWGIIRMGARIFDVAENPKDGASLALPRREARAARRRLRRRRHRIERIKNLFTDSKLLTAEQLEKLYDGKKLEDIYNLRVRALGEAMSNEEIARILLHLAHRRGFKSNRKAEKADKENGLLLTAVSENAKRMQENNYRTIGEMFFKDDNFKEYKRNKGGSYLTTVAREMVTDEAKQIFTAQREFGNNILTEEFEQRYLEILLSQRNFDEGPGGESPYGGDQIEKMIGYCTFEPGEKRCAKASYSFEYFNLLQKVNHLRLLVDGEKIALDDSQKKKIIMLAKTKADLKYNQIRKELGLGEKVLFNGLVYNGNVDEVEKKAKFNYLPAYHQMRKELDKVSKGHIETLDLVTLNEIGRILSVYKSDAKRVEAFSKLNLANEDVEALLNINGLRKFGHLSLKALDKIIPYLEQGLIYNEACAAAGYEFRGHVGNEKTFLLPGKTDEMENITSPVARRAISQTIKVINAIIREQGESPLYLNIELAREMAKDFDERKKIKKEQDDNQAKNERLLERIRTEFHKQNPTGLDLVKFKLWEEQDGRSPYSGKTIEINRLFEPGYVDVDHIVPYSISFDDTLKNKVLVFASENREKGKSLPIQYLARKFGQEAVDNFRVRVNNDVRNYKKRLNLLKAEVTEEDRNKFKERNLQDTKTISRFMYNYINDHLLFAESETGKKKRVTAVNGAITSYLRKRWGINKVRANGDKHHAVDALVVACTTDKLIKDLSYHSQYHEVEYDHGEKESLLVDRATGEILKRFPYPWEDFRAELMARLSNDPSTALRRLQLLFYQNKDLNDIKPIFVSRMPRRKITGAAHKATVKGARHIEQGIVVSKKNLTDLKLNKDGEIENYYAPESDRLLYEALKEQLKKFNGNAKKAFEQDFFKPKADGTLGPKVKKVKVYEKSTLNVSVQQGTGAADNDSMVRVDVYKVEGDGYYLVPIYVADTLRKKLPNKAIVAHKPYEEWIEMDTRNFVFSLYPNDLVKFVHKKEVVFNKVNDDSTLIDSYQTKEEIVYYKKTGIANATVSIINADNTYAIPSLGIKTLLSLDKYQVDVLGNYHKVGKETLQTFSRYQQTKKKP